jgi:hypothetical protein
MIEIDSTIKIITIEVRKRGTVLTGEKGRVIKTIRVTEIEDGTEDKCITIFNTISLKKIGFSFVNNIQLSLTILYFPMK